MFGTNLRKTKNGFKRHLADFEKPAPAPKKRRAATFTVKVTRDNRQEDYFGQNQELEQKKEIREQYLSGVKGGLEDWLNFRTRRSAGRQPVPLERYSTRSANNDERTAAWRCLP